MIGKEDLIISITTPSGPGAFPFDILLRYKTTVSSAREKVSIRLCAQKRTWRDLIGCKTHINNRG